MPTRGPVFISPWPKKVKVKDFYDDFISQLSFSRKKKMVHVWSISAVPKFKDSF
jgi:hypothetical protein